MAGLAQGRCGGACGAHTAVRLVRLVGGLAGDCCAALVRPLLPRCCLCSCAALAAPLQPLLVLLRRAIHTAPAAGMPCLLRCQHAPGGRSTVGKRHLSTPPAAATACRTFTTSYAGSVEQQGGTSITSSGGGPSEPAASSLAAAAAAGGGSGGDGASSTPGAPQQGPQWEVCSEQIPRALLTSRDPILFYDELPLYESELDDHGSSHVTLKARMGLGGAGGAGPAAAVRRRWGLPGWHGRQRAPLACSSAGVSLEMGYSAVQAPPRPPLPPRHTHLPPVVTPAWACLLTRPASPACADARHAALLVRAAPLLAAGGPSHGAAARGERWMF